MEAQEYEIKGNISFQEKNSAISIEENGKKLFTGSSRHIDIHYFFVKYRFDINGMSIAYWGTEHIIAYFFTK